MENLIEDFNNFRIVWQVQLPEKVSASFTVYQTHRDIDDNIVFERKDSLSSDDVVSNLNEAEVYLDGFVKWDGCANILFQNTYMHFCGAADLVAHIELIKHLYNDAFVKMGRLSDDGIIVPGCEIKR